MTSNYTEVGAPYYVAAGERDTGAGFKMTTVELFSGHHQDPADALAQARQKFGEEAVVLRMGMRLFGRQRKPRSYSLTLTPAAIEGGAR